METLVVILMVGASVAYLARSFKKSFAAKKAAGPCGTCPSLKDCRVASMPARK
ncbi:MAG: hypothetical protein GY940_10930 [bacterium]|nr:hypothetical protein [bacterium]